MPNTFDVTINGKTYSGRYVWSEKEWYDCEPQHFYKCDLGCELLNFFISNNKLVDFTFDQDNCIKKMLTDEVLTEQEAEAKARTFLSQYCDISKYKVIDKSCSSYKNVTLREFKFEKRINGYESYDWVSVRLCQSSIIGMDSHNLGLYTEETSPDFDRGKLESELSSIMTAYMEKEGLSLSDYTDKSFGISTIRYVQRENEKWELFVIFSAGLDYYFLVEVENYFGI